MFCSVWSEACGQPLGRRRLGHVEWVQLCTDNVGNSAPYGPSGEGHVPPLHTTADQTCILMLVRLSYLCGFFFFNNDTSAGP